MCLHINANFVTLVRANNLFLNAQIFYLCPNEFFPKLTHLPPQLPTVFECEKKTFGAFLSADASEGLFLGLRSSWQYSSNSAPLQNNSN